MSGSRNVKHFSGGFTIVEMLVVIIVLGIIVGLSVFSFRSWQKSTAESQIKSDLASAKNAMKNALNFSAGQYPTSLPFTASSGVTLALTMYSSNTSYCVQGSHAKTTVIYKITPTDSSAVVGTCP